MRLVLAKVAVSVYLCYMGYLHYSDEILGGMLRQAVQANLDQMALHPQNRLFLDQYLIPAMYFCLGLSLLAVISKTLLPKLLVVLGIGLWSYFSWHPSAHVGMQMPRALEMAALAGGVLFVGGCEYVENDGWSLLMGKPPSFVERETKEE